jgi:hypothetical protein
LGGNRQLRSWDLLCNGFVADVRYYLLNDDELGLWPGGCAQIFHYFDAVLVSPVVDYCAEDEDGDVPLPIGCGSRTFWAKEVGPECQ